LEPTRSRAYVHEKAAPYLLGKDPREVARHAHALGQGMAFRAIGAEARGLSAIDVALWDLFGQSVNLPIYRCLGRSGARQHPYLQYVRRLRLQHL